MNKLFHHFLRDGSVADWPVDSWLLLLGFSEEWSDVGFSPVLRHLFQDLLVMIDNILPITSAMLERVILRIKSRYQYPGKIFTFHNLEEKHENESGKSMKNSTSAN